MSKAIMLVISLLCDTFPISTPLFMTLVEEHQIAAREGFILIIYPEHIGR